MLNQKNESEGKDILSLIQNLKPPKKIFFDLEATGICSHNFSLKQRYYKHDFPKSTVFTSNEASTQTPIVTNVYQTTLYEIADGDCVSCSMHIRTMS